MNEIVLNFCIGFDQALTVQCLRVAFFRPGFISDFIRSTLMAVEETAQIFLRLPGIPELYS